MCRHNSSGHVHQSYLCSDVSETQWLKKWWNRSVAVLLVYFLTCEPVGGAPKDCTGLLHIKKAPKVLFNGDYRVSVTRSCLQNDLPNHSTGSCSVAPLEQHCKETRHRTGETWVLHTNGPGSSFMFRSRFRSLILVGGEILASPGMMRESSDNFNSCIHPSISF